MSTQRNYDAYVLAHPYALSTNTDGKYEYGDAADPNHRWMMLANRQGKSAIYVKYDPDLLDP